MQHNSAPASRAWHISRELNSSGIKSIIVARKAVIDCISGENIVAIKPLVNRGFIGNLLFLFQISVVVIRVLFNAKIDQVLARGYSLAPLFITLKLWGKNITYDFNGYRYKEQIVGGHRLRAKITRLFDWLALKLADHVLVIREELCQDLPTNFQKKTLLLPNGVDLEEFAAAEDENILARYNLPPHKKLVGFIGNWEAWIAIEDILASTKYFDDKVKVVIIGAGRGLEEYKDTYPSILFTGRIAHQDAVELIKKMDVCICPYSTHVIAKNKSYRKVLEYLAAGKPIVASNAEGREKFIREGNNALLYQAGEPKDLADRVKTILSDERLYARMSCNNLELARQFSWREVIKRSGLIKMLQG